MRSACAGILRPSTPNFCGYSSHQCALPVRQAGIPDIRSSGVIGLSRFDQAVKVMFVYEKGLRNDGEPLVDFAEKLRFIEYLKGGHWVHLVKQHGLAAEGMLVHQCDLSRQEEVR